MKVTFQTIRQIDIRTFLVLSSDIPVVDVRSPSEYLAGHIPGSVNIPLFDDEERKAVGTTYSKEGRTAAIITGLKLAGPSMHSKLESALELSSGGNLLIHCWRGGMRSEAMAWLFSQGGIACKVLLEGYKAYRNHILAELSARKNTIILGGLTGTGKTGIIRMLSENGHKAIDLERLANHKGSAFGSLGQPPQPTSEHFANLLFGEWSRIGSEVPLWLEDESLNIGNVFMPKEFYDNMQKSPAIILLMDVKTRLARLAEEYSGYPVPELVESVMKISRRMGGNNAGEAVRAIERGDMAKAIEITLGYYDKAYMFGLKKRQGVRVTIHTDTVDPAINAGKVLEAAQSAGLWD